MVVADAVHDRQLSHPCTAARSRPWSAGSRNVVDLAQLVGADAELRPRAVIGVVAIRHDGVQSVIGARQFNHDQDALRRSASAARAIPPTDMGTPSAASHSGVEAERAARRAGPHRNYRVMAIAKILVSGRVQTAFRRAGIPACS